MLMDGCSLARGVRSAAPAGRRVDGRRLMITAARAGVDGVVFGWDIPHLTLKGSFCQPRPQAWVFGSRPRFGPGGAVQRRATVNGPFRADSDCDGRSQAFGL